MIERIKGLYFELKEFKKEKTIYKELEAELKKLADNIESLRNKKKEIDLLSIKNEIEKMEDEYKRVLLEIDTLALQSKEYIYLNEIKDLYQKLEDNEFCLEKTIKFLRTLIISFKINDETGDDIFGVLPYENETLFVIKIHRDLEELLRMCENKKFYSNVLLEVRGLFKNEIEENTACKVHFFAAKENLYIIVRKTLEENNYETIGNETIGNETISNKTISNKYETISNNYEKEKDREINGKMLFEEISEISVSCLIEQAKRISKIIFLVLKDNLAKKMISDNYDLDFIKENNDKLKGSDNFVTSLDEWILDIIMKNILRISIKSKNLNNEENLIEVKGKGIFSKKYVELRSCLRLFNDIKSSRKEKAKKTLEKAIVKFFKNLNEHNLEKLFCTYSEIDHFISIEKQFSFLEEIEEERDIIFCKILKLSTLFELDFSKDPLIGKSELRALSFDFIENVNRFIEKNTKSIFIKNFFKEIYSNLFELTIKPKKYTTDEKNSFIEIIKYAIDLSYEYDLENLDEYTKLSEFLDIVTCPITKIENLYKNKLKSLTNYEIRTIIRMFFDKEPIRDALLDTLI